MKIQVKDMREAQEIEIRGHETWLKEIYGSFLGTEGLGLQGKLRVSPEPYGVFTVKGEISYVPLLACSRCEREIPWAIQRSIDVRFLDRAAAVGYAELSDDSDADASEESDDYLSPEDLDTYYLGEDGELDLEMVINDIVQTAIPSRTIALSQDKKSCTICLDNVESPVVHEEEAGPDSSPFAVLKKLNLPDA